MKAGRLPRGRPAESKSASFEFLDKDVDYANRIVLADPVFQAFRKQRALPAIRALDEALIRSSANHIARITPNEAFHTARSLATEEIEAAQPCMSASPPRADKQADISGCPLCATSRHMQCTKLAPISAAILRLV